MLLKKSAWQKYGFLLLAFAIPFLGMLFVMLVSGYEPFGSYSMLYSDMYHQYYPFFVEFRRVLRSGDSLLYNWSVGMGLDYLGLVGYYLASPLNLLSVLVPDSLALEYFSLLMPMKLGFAAMFFALFLSRIYGKRDIAVSVFGGFYGLCAWAMAFQWNVMWLDSFALTPLVALGTVYLIRDRRVILYTLTLFLAIFSNYYIGLFVCIFVALIFFCYEICRWQGWNRFFQDLGRIALFSVLAIGMTAILELPVLAALKTTQSSVNKFPDTFRLNIASTHDLKGLLDAMRQVAGNMGGSIEPSFKEGLPNIYCGVGTLLLAMLYLMAGDVKLRDKLCCVFLLLFFNVSFIIRQLDYIWHGFHFTNMIPYRFSYLYSFVLLYMAYRAWLLRRKFGPVSVLCAAVAAGALLACSNTLLDTEKVIVFGTNRQLHVYIIYNVSFLLLYLGAMLYGSIRRSLPPDAPAQEARRVELAYYQRRGLSRAWMLTVVGLELIATLVSFGLYFPGTNATDYPRGTEYAASMIRYMHEREEETLFYRAETSHSQTLNDGALNQYNGISTFTSSANVRVTEFMKALGYGAKNTYNRYCYEESSPVSDLFLGIRYMIERDGKEKESAFWTDVHHYGGVHLLQNNTYLPLGFLAEPELAMLDFQKDREPFDFQNDLFATATGLDRKVWYTLSGNSLIVAGIGVEISAVDSSGTCSYQNATANSAVTYTYTADRSGFMCIHLDLPKRNTFYVSVNGIERYRETISLPQMIAVGDVEAGDQIEIRVMCASGEKSRMDIRAAILDNTLFLEGYGVLSASVWELTEFDTTFVEGTVRCGRDGLLYTSIPENGNWRVYVDGTPAETVLVGDAMISVPLTEGTHTVTFRYSNSAFRLGMLVTLLCVLAFCCLAPIYSPPLRSWLKSLKKK